MTDKEKKSKIADILMDFQEEYSNEVVNRPMLASLYAGNILSFINSLQEEPVATKVLEDMLNAKTAAESLGISQEEHDRIVDELIYGKEPELVDDGDLPKEEPVSDDFDSWYEKEWVPFGHSSYTNRDKLKDAFKAGAKWQKEQEPAWSDEAKTLLAAQPNKSAFIDALVRGEATQTKCPHCGKVFTIKTE